MQPLWLPCEKGKRRKGQFIRNNFREDAAKVDIQSHRLLIANLARLQAILIAGGAPQRPVGLLKSVGQHGELAAVAQRTGGTARPSAVKAVVLWKLPFLWVLVVGERAVCLWQRPVILVTVSIDFFFAHQRLFLGLLFLLENFLHEVSLVHWSSNDFQIISIDDYLSKIYNRWGLVARLLLAPWYC